MVPVAGVRREKPESTGQIERKAKRAVAALSEQQRLKLGRRAFQKIRIRPGAGALDMSAPVVERREQCSSLM